MSRNKQKKSEYDKKYYLKNKERIKERKRLWYQRNKHKQIKKTIEWISKNKNKYNKYMRKWILIFVCIFCTSALYSNEKKAELEIKDKQNKKIKQVKLSIKKRKKIEKRGALSYKGERRIKEKDKVVLVAKIIENYRENNEEVSNSPIEK